jgi:enterochelin esterase-like enzyme
VTNTIRDLVERRELTTEAVARLVEAGPVPLTEQGSCTFFYRGQAEAVRLQHFGVGLPADLDFTRVERSDLWYLVLDLAAGTRLEYKLEVTGPGGATLIEDPLNPRAARNPFGANSVCLAAGYEEPAWATFDPAAPEGVLKDHSLWSEAFSRPAITTLYLPPGFDPGGQLRYPLLVVHDGGDYVQYAELKSVLDNLLHQGVVRPLIVAFSHPGERLVEYADDPRHARFLTEELVPDLEAELPLLAEPRGRGLMGASFGAVAALSVAHRSPGTYGRLLLQSGSFARSDGRCAARSGSLWQPVTAFVDRFVAEPAAVSERIYASCGIYESLICENRALLPTLTGTGMEVRLVEALDGHNWVSWRDRLGEALSWLFSDDSTDG